MRRFLRRLLIGAVLVPAGVYLALALAFWVWGTVQLHLELKRWEALGVPTRLEDTRPPDVPPEANAAPLYESLRGKLQLSQAEEEALHNPWEIADPAAFIEPYKDILSTLHEAARRPNLVWDGKYYTTVCKTHCDCENIEYLWLGINSRSLIPLLMLESDVAFGMDNNVKAAEALQSANRLIALSRAKGMEINAFGGTADEHKYLWYLYNFAHKPEFKVDQIESAIPDIDWIEDFRRGLVASLLQVQEKYRLDFDYLACGFGMQDHFFPYPGRWLLMGGINDINHAHELSTIRYLYEQAPDIAVGNKYDDALYSEGTWAQEAWKYLFEYQENEFSGSPQSLSLNLFLQESALRAVIGIQKYKETNGIYPNKWELPVDPVTTRPLEYQKEGNGFVIRRQTNRRYGLENWEWRWP